MEHQILPMRYMDMRKLEALLGRLFGGDFEVEVCTIHTLLLGILHSVALLNLPQGSR